LRDKPQKMGVIYKLAVSAAQYTNDQEQTKKIN
jgi:hypothetical protein